MVLHGSEHEEDFEVIRRFQIEDIIFQGAEGITFRALDTENDAMVAVRRFFPFGAHGGGLHHEEITAYNIAVGRLSGLSHPALRSVVAGGCDPIDGIPYIATEWIEGKPLSTIIEQGHLSDEDATRVIICALEVCELLSHVLAEEAIWVETDPRTIIIGNEASGREITFWISPLKWLVGDEQARGFDAIIDLAEEVMDWKGRKVSDQAGRGLGGWIKWLRTATTTVTIHEAREMLAASVGMDPPPSAKRLAIKAHTRVLAPLARVKKASSKTPWYIGIGLALVIAGLAGCWWVSQRKNTASMITSVVRWDKHDLLVAHATQQVTVEGAVTMKDLDESGKTIYLMFGQPSDKTSVRVGLEIKDDNTAAVSNAFDTFVGKTIQAKGIIRIRKNIGADHPDLMIESTSSIKIIE